MSTDATLPVLYSNITPLRSDQHRSWKAGRTARLPWLAQQNLVPLTSSEFVPAQRHFPIVFSQDQEAVPLALMGLKPGSNVFVANDGTVAPDVYLPAYARRYPFMLARLHPDAAELSLCFDANSGLVGELEEGRPLFEAGAPSLACHEILDFCRKFERADEETRQFVAELQRHDLLVDGQTEIRRAGEAPYVAGGFLIVDADRLGRLRGHVLRQWTERGILQLIHAHLFSLQLMGRLAITAGTSNELLLDREALLQAN